METIKFKWNVFNSNVSSETPFSLVIWEKTLDY